MRGQGRHGRPQFGQAATIIHKFGGEASIARILGISRITPYKWNYAPPYGTNGLIPQLMVPRILAAARLEGVVLTADDWLPVRVKYRDGESDPLEPETSPSTPEPIEGD